MPNVMFAGPQPYESLPEWAKAFDVAIIPYRLTHQVLHANPLKLREYLATGKPVVTVSTPAIRQFAGYVHVAESQEQFLNGIERALAEEFGAGPGAADAGGCRPELGLPGGRSAPHGDEPLVGKTDHREH